MTGRRELDNIKSSMDPMALNNLVVSMRGILKRARLQVIHKLSRQSTNLKKKKGTEIQVAANVKKAARLVDEIKHIKGSNLDQVAKKALANTSKFEDITKQANTSLQERAEMRVVTHQLVTSKVAEWREKHEDWKSLAAFILSKNTGRRYKKKKKKGTEQESALARKPWDVTVDVAPPSGQLVKDKPLPVKPAEKDETQSLQDESPSVQKTNRLKESLNDRQGKMEVDSDVEEKTDDESDDDDAESESDLESDTSPVTVRPRNEKVNVDPADSIEVTCDPSLKPGVTDSVPSGPSSHEMVIKKFSLDEFSDDEESIPIKSIKSGAGDDENIEKESDSEEDDDDDGLTKLTKKPQNRKKDSFFLTADGEVDSSDSEAEDDKEDDDDDDDDDESDSQKAKLTESMFVGALSQGPNHRGRRGGSQRGGKYERQTNRPQYQKGGRGSYHPYRSDRGGHSRGRKQAAGPDRPGRPASKPVHPPSKPAAQASSKAEEKMHPSWEASRRKKEQQQSIQAFQGKKITFDDD